MPYLAKASVIMKICYRKKEKGKDDFKILTACSITTFLYSYMCSTMEALYEVNSSAW